MDFGFDAELDTVTLAEAGARVPLMKLDGSPLLNANKAPVALVLHGSDSKAYRDASRALARKRVERSAASGGNAITDAQLDAAEADRLELAVACTKGWEGVVDSKGKDVPFSTEAIREFYRRYPPAQDQAEAAVVDRARFTKPSSGA